MIKKISLFFSLATMATILIGQSNEILIEQLKTQVAKAQYTEGQGKALKLALMGYDYIAPGDPQLEQLLYETYYSSSDEEVYDEGEYTEITFNTSDWSPDGQQIAVALSDGTIRLYEKPFTEYTVIHQVENQSILDVDFSPDGKQLAFADVNGQLEILNLTSNSIVQNWKHDDYIRSVEWSNNGREIAAGGDENILYVYDTQNAELLQSFSGHTDWIRNISWSEDDKLLVTASDDATSIVWSMQSGKMLKKHDDHSDYCRDVVFAPKGTAMVSTSDDLSAYLYSNATDASPAKNIGGHEEWIMAVDWSKDGKYILTADNGGQIILNATKTGDQTYFNAVNVETAWVDIDFSPDNKHFLATSLEELTLYQIGSSEPVSRILITGMGDNTSVKNNSDSELALETILNAKLPTATRLFFSPDKEKLGIINSEYKLEVINMITGQLLYTIEQHEDWVRNIAWSKNGQYLATASDDMMVGVWNAETGEMLHFLSGHEDWVRDVDFAPDSKTLLSVGDDGVVRAWDVETGNQLSIGDKIENFIMTVDWSPGQTYIATQDSEGFLSIWQSNNNKQVFKSNGNTQEGSVKWLDDKNLTVISIEGEVFNWNANSGMSMNNKAFGAVSSKGITATAKGPYVSVTGGLKPVFLEGHTSPIIGMEWSPDGHYLVSYTVDAMGIWEPSKDHLVAMISTVGVFNKEVIWLSDNKSFYVAGSPKVTLPVSSIRAKIEEEGILYSLTKEDVIVYDLEKIFLLEENISSRLLQKSDSDVLEAIADFYEQRANSREVGAARTADEQKAKAFRMAAE